MSNDAYLVCPTSLLAPKHLWAERLRLVLRQGVQDWRYATAARERCVGPFRFWGEDVSLLGAAGSGRGDAVRLMGCEGSVSLAWRSGEG